MSPETELKLNVAKRIYRFAHPRKSWQAHPDFRQLTEQERYLNLAAVLINQIRGEPDAQT